MFHPLKQETVYERSKRNGGYIMGRNHPAARRLAYLERQKDVQEAAKQLPPAFAKAPSRDPDTGRFVREE